MTEAPSTRPPVCNTWLYAVVKDVDRDLLAQLTGVAGEPLRTIADAGLVAVVGSVPQADFDEPALQGHLEDLRWLEQAVRAHHRVIDTLARAGTTLPLRFATMYRDDHRAAALLAEQREEFLDTLDRVADHLEWGVKIYLETENSDRPEAPVTTPATPVGAAGGNRPGTEYLIRRRTQRERHDRARDEARRSAAAVHAALADRARDAAEHPPQSTEATGLDDPMILNGAYLVSRDQADEFAAAVAALAERHPSLRLELTGPWPPYSFVQAGPSEPRE